MTHEHFETATRKQVAEILPSILHKTLMDYESFVQTGDDEKNTAAFVKKQTACKTAIAHITLLLKLAKWAGLEGDMSADEDYSKALEIAKESYTAFQRQMEETREEEDEDDSEP